MRRLVLVLFVLISQNLFSQSRLDFRWADPRKDHALFEAAQQALANVDYTSIREIAQLNGHYLLLTTLRETDREFSFEWDRWEAFELVPDKHSVRSIWSGYRFTPVSSLPIRLQEDSGELWFQYDTCNECEPARVMTYFFVDPKQDRLAAQTWGKDSVIQIGNSDVEGASEFIWAVQDFDKDGFDDVYVWYRYSDERNSVVETLDKYSVKDGKPLLTQSKSKAEIAAYKKRLCVPTQAKLSGGQESSLCKPFQ